jgi:WD40 repeat protein
LTAQQQQLLKRARPAEDPVQAQTLSPDATLLALGDAAGRISVMANPSEEMAWPSTPVHELRLEQPVSSLKFIDAQTLLVASGSELLLWTFGQNMPEKLAGHADRVRSIDVQNGLAISGDESGQLFVWDLSQKVVVAELKANTSIRAVCLIPGTRDFIYAGARGGQSADILAYRLPDDSTNLAPARLGQLRMSRQHTYPPSRLSVSPDGNLLVIGNSTNGDLIALKKAVKSAAANQPRFPYEQPADLAAESDMSWLLSHHLRPVNDLQWSPDGRLFLTASDDRRIGLWSRAGELENKSSATPPETLPEDLSSRHSSIRFERFVRGHGARVFQAVFLDKTGNRISSSSADGFCRLWNLNTLDDDSREIRGAFQLSAVHDSPNSRLRNAARRSHYTFAVAAASAHQFEELSPKIDGALNADGALSENLATSVVLNRDQRVHRGSIRAVQFDRDGRKLVSGAADGSIVVWDVASATSVTGPTTRPGPMMAAERFHEGHESNISRMSMIGASQNILATAGFDGSLRLWNMDPRSGRTGTQQQVLTGLGLVNTFGSSPDGRLLITSSVKQDGATQDDATQGVQRNAGECRIWKLDDLLHAPLPASIAALSGVHRADVTSISVSADSLRIATGGRDGIIAVWDANSAECLSSVRAHGKDTIVTTLKWLSDGTLLSAGLDGKLARWSLEPTSASNSEARSEKAARPFRLVTHQQFARDRTPIEQISLAPDETRLLLISVRTDRRQKTTTYQLEEWNLATPDSPRTIVPATVAGKIARVLSSAQWSSDGQRALVCVDDAVQIFETATWRVERVVSAGAGGVTDAQFVASEAPDQQQIVTFDGSSAALWNLVGGEQLAAFRGPYPVTSVGFLQTEAKTLVLSAGETLRVFDGDAKHASFGRPLFHLQKSQLKQIAAVSICPSDLSQILTADATGELSTWRWDSKAGRVIKSAALGSLKTSVTEMKYSPDGQWIACVTSTGELIVTDREGTPLMKLRPGDDQPVELATVEFSSDGQHVAVGGRIARTSESIGWVVNLPDAFDNPPLEAALPQLVCRFSGHAAGGISGLRFIPGTPYVVSGGHDGALILWNWQDALPAAIPAAYEAYRFLEDGQTTAHQGPVTSLSVSVSGQVCSGSEDGRVVLWNLPLLMHRD